MAQLFLVRHGQASYGAADYDRLSDLGWQQARWLGEHFAERGIRFDAHVRGTLRRHDETLRGILEGMRASASHEAHPGLNEYEARTIVAAHFGAPDPAPQGADKRAHFRKLREALHAWTEGTIPPGGHEPFADFQARVMGALEAVRARADAERILVVSSGGPIATILSTVTGMPARMMVDLNMQARNGSYSEFVLSPKGVHFVSFNNVPHLDRPDRPGAVTYA